MVAPEGRHKALPLQMMQEARLQNRVYEFLQEGEMFLDVFVVEPGTAVMDCDLICMNAHDPELTC